MSPPPNTSSYYVVLVYVLCVSVHLYILLQQCELTCTFIILCGKIAIIFKLRII
jgi:hypothetical protein